MPLELLLDILEQRLAVALYPAHLAGLRWSFANGPRALQLSAHGFAERLPALVSTLLRELLRWAPEETARLFEPKRELQARATQGSPRALARVPLHCESECHRVPLSAAEQPVVANECPMFRPWARYGDRLPTMPSERRR